MVHPPMVRPAPPVIMSFGKHTGEPITKLPLDYLCWLSRSGAARDPRLAAALDELHEQRCGAYHPPDDERWR